VNCNSSRVLLFFWGEKFGGAFFYEALEGFGGELAGVIGVAAGLGGEGLGAVRRGEEGIHDYAVAADAGVGGGGAATTHAELFEEGALGGDGAPSGGMVDGLEEGEGVVVVLAYFDSQSALAGVGDKLFCREVLGDFGLEAEADEASGGENNAVVVRAEGFVDSSVHVTTDGEGLEVGPEAAELGGAAGTAGADSSAWRELVQGHVFFADEDVAGVDALGDGGDGEAGRRDGREVFEAVDGEVDFLAEEGVFDLFDEDAPAKRGKGNVGGFVAASADGLDIEGLGGVFGAD